MTRVPTVRDRVRLAVLKRTLRRPGRAARLAERVVGERRTAGRLRRYGLRPVRFERVPVAHLLVQRPVLSEVVPSGEATPLPFLDAYFSTGEGHDWSITRSMQARLLRAAAQGGLDDLRDTDYWRWHVSLREASVNERPDDWIEAKAVSLLELGEAIRSRGYLYDGLAGYIWALEEPLVTTRYGLAHDVEGYEIYDGHHRAAAAAVAGIASVVVLVLEDVATQTPFGIPLDVVRAPA